MEKMSCIWKKLFPFVYTVENYSKEKGKADFFAGLTVAIVAAPQAMAYAHFAGFSPIYGLYTLIFPVIISALWSSSPYLVAGPTNALCMLVYASANCIILFTTFVSVFLFGLVQAIFVGILITLLLPKFFRKTI